MNLYELKKKVDLLVVESLQKAVEDNLFKVLPNLDESCDDFQSQEEKDAVELVCQTAKQLGGAEMDYSEGVFYSSFENKQSVEDFSAFLEANEKVDSYEIEAVTASDLGSEEMDLETIHDDDETYFDVYVYMDPELVTYDPEEIDDDGDEYDDENLKIYEVKRVIKINFRGKRRIKMQCRPGFKWDNQKRTCVKIGGAELVRKRLALRKAVRTKKAMGSAFKVRVLRKRRKALRFRKSLGLN